VLDSDLRVYFGVFVGEKIRTTKAILVIDTAWFFDPKIGDCP
jgi:hypothetical protein